MCDQPLAGRTKRLFFGWERHHSSDRFKHGFGPVCLGSQWYVHGLGFCAECRWSHLQRDDGLWRRLRPRLQVLPNLLVPEQTHCPHAQALRRSTIEKWYCPTLPFTRSSGFQGSQSTFPLDDSPCPIEDDVCHQHQARIESARCFSCAKAQFPLDTLPP